jgi:hypothetical protein
VVPFVFPDRLLSLYCQSDEKDGTDDQDAGGNDTHDAPEQEGEMKRRLEIGC